MAGSPVNVPNQEMEKHVQTAILGVSWLFLGM